MVTHELFTFAQRTGFLPAYSFLRRTFSGSQIAIMMYHRVSSIENNYLMSSLPTVTFERQIKYLKENFQLISLDKLSELLKGPEKLPRKAAAITFDDGYKDNFVYAYPILKKYNAPATIFLSTGYIDTDKLFWWDLSNYLVANSLSKRITLKGAGTFQLNSESEKHKTKMQIRKILKRLSEKEKCATISELSKVTGVGAPSGLGKDAILSWAEIKQMASAEITFGAHTVNHPILTNVDKEVCQYEIIQSKRDIEEKLGKPVTSFSYPDGAFNVEIRDIVKKAGFACATITNHFGLVDRGSNIFSLRRIAAFEDFNVFKGMLSGVAGDSIFLNHFVR
jgi:peptidoglycan/xylan/chitin deacetylase (PgdA/CDA1 family)